MPALKVYNATKKILPKKAAKGGKKPAPKKSTKPGTYPTWYGANRKMYLPGGLFDPSVDCNPVLDGTLPGDYGCDIFNLAKDKETLTKYREYELIHGRWAMLAVVGVVVPEAFQLSGLDVGTSGVWYEAGKNIFEDGHMTWFGSAIPLPLPVFAAVQVGIMGAIETWRDTQSNAVAGVTLPNLSGNADRLYPGKDFYFDPLELGLDPLGLGGGPDLKELQVKEIKNARLAMVAFLGVAVQAGVTGEGPFANWYKHVSNPFGYNLLTVVGKGLGSAPLYEGLQ